MSPSPQIVVIGGGISGLACAWRLHKLNLPVLLLERSSRFGGIIGAVDKDGFHFDLGPQSIRVSGSTLAFMEELGLGGKLRHAPRHAPRYILRRGRLIPAPLGPIAFFQTPLLSWKTRLRLLGDPFAHSHPPPDDESVAHFVRRKFGQDLLDNLAAPLMSGIYAGDTEKLSLRSTFPRLREFEEQSGSLVRGMLKARRSSAKAAQDGAGAASETRAKRKAPRATLSNFPGGLIELTNVLAAGLGESARPCVEVLEIRRRPAGGTPPAYEVVCREAGASLTFEAAAVIVATPTAQAAPLLAGVDPRFAETLGCIEYAPIAQVSSGYRLKDLAPLGAKRDGDALSGFGFLVPRSEGLRLLGTVWNSSLFPGRAPAGAALFTSFLGGATDPGIRRLSESEILQIARTELGQVMRTTNPPIVEHVAFWDRALPQYNLGHPAIIAALKELCASHPGIFLAGNYLDGPSIPACIDQANRLAGNAARLVNR